MAAKLSDRRFVRNLILIIVMMSTALFPLGLALPAAAHVAAASHQHVHGSGTGQHQHSSPVAALDDHHHEHQARSEAGFCFKRDHCKDCLAGCYCGLACHAMQSSDIVMAWPPLADGRVLVLSGGSPVTSARLFQIDRPPRPV